MTTDARQAGAEPQGAAPPHDGAEAIGDLYRVHAVGLVRFALLLVGDKATAEDVVQEAFLNLQRRWHGLRDYDNVVGYLRTAVLNGSRSVLRRRKRARLLPVRHDPPVWSAEAATIDNEERRAMLAAVAALLGAVAAVSATR